MRMHMSCRHLQSYILTRRGVKSVQSIIERPMKSLGYFVRYCARHCIIYRVLPLMNFAFLHFQSCKDFRSVITKRKNRVFAVFLGIKNILKNMDHGKNSFVKVFINLVKSRFENIFLEINM